METKALGLCVSVKSFNDEERYIEGIATTPTVDRMGDIVEPLGARFEREIPLLLDHKSDMRVGRVQLGKATKAGIPFKAWMPKVSEPGQLRDRVELGWQELKYGLLKFVSIGFRPINNAIENIKATGGLRFLETEILELSLVPIPAQPDARISLFKSYALPNRRASSGNAPSSAQPAGATAPNQGKTMHTQEQQLAALRETLSTHQTRMKEIDTAVEEKGFDAESRAEIADLATQIEDTKTRISMKESQIEVGSRARPVADVSKSAPYGFVKKQADVEDSFKGETGLKRALANIVAQAEVKKGNLITPLQVVQERWGKTNPTLVQIMKAGIAGGGTDSGEWGAELAQADTRYTGDFIQYLYAKTVFDRLPLREVPHNVVIKGQDGAFTGYFVGQSKAIKVSKGDFSSTSTVPYKAAGLTVVSNELLRDSSPSALQLCGDGLREAVAQAVDSLFFSTTAVSSGVAPAGILNGVSIGSTNGGDAQSVATDIKALWAPFITANNTEGSFAFVMTPTLAVALSLMRNALGQLEYPGMNASGGTFMGYPVFVGGNVGAGDVILMNCSEIWKIGDLGVSLSTSDSAMIEQDGAPTGATDTPTAASATMVSMYQEDSTAIRVIRPISWGKRRSGAVSYIGNAAWGAESS